MLIDTHAHLYWESYKSDLNEVLKRAKDAGVNAIMNIGVDIETSQKALEQTKNIKGLSVYSTIGIHPHEASTFNYKDIAKLEKIYLNNKSEIVAIGECGLDYFFESNPGFTPTNLSPVKLKQLQRQLFQAQIDLAKKLNLPLSVHCRDDRSKDPQNNKCWNTAIEMTKNHFGVYHCYSGLPQTTTYLLQATNFYVAFAANITYPKNDYLRETVKIIPLERILLETDSPFLAPQSRRGQRNEPSAVKEIAELIAELKGISFEEVAAQTTQNAKKIFQVAL